MFQTEKVSICKEIKGIGGVGSILNISTIPYLKIAPEKSGAIFLPFSGFLSVLVLCSVKL